MARPSHSFWWSARPPLFSATSLAWASARPSARLAKYSIMIRQQLGLSAEDLDRLRISALLHDVGKIGVDDRVLKKPGALTAEEFQIMKQHPSKGANIMRPVAQLKDMLPGIELHHERIDGQGYPYRLQGD